MALMALSAKKVPDPWYKCYIGSCGEYIIIFT